MTELGIYVQALCDFIQFMESNNMIWKTNNWSKVRGQQEELSRNPEKQLERIGGGRKWHGIQVSMDEGKEWNEERNTRWKTRAIHWLVGRKRKTRGGRANHVRERERVCCQGKEEESKGWKGEGEEEEAVVLRSVRMNAFPLSGEEACCLSLSVIPLVCAERERGTDDWRHGPLVSELFRRAVFWECWSGSGNRRWACFCWECAVYYFGMQSLSNCKSI